MKFTINTNYQSAGTVVLNGLVRRLSEVGHSVTKNDWANYADYDLAIFMAPDSKVREAKKMDSKIICGIFDPKISRSWQIEEAKAADFLIVSSIEQRETFLKYNKNIFIYYMFPDTVEIKKEHKTKDKIIIGYHGNKQHLDAMAEASWALDEVAKEHNIEFWAIYNIKKLGKWRLNTPKICPVKHIQWSEETQLSDLSQCDIGLVPSVLPTLKLFARPFRSFFYNLQGYNNDDYVIRYKMSNNPGRIYVFSQLHIPVITDFTPSACEIIKDGVSGMLVGGRSGWEAALKKLINNVSSRESISRNLKDSIDKNYSPDITFEKFLLFLKSLNEKK
jgi:glycosyltransferase involved in cell wall biosynthesis